MAGTYYKYAERNASDQIDWLEIGKNVTDMLKKETDIREQKKAAIDKASREYGETLADTPQGEHQGINQWWLTYASNAEQARLMQDRLLKSGQLKPKDYMVMRQNIVDGTANATSLVKDYQAEYSDKMERYKKGDSQALEQWLMAESEAFANFNNTELYINPTDFTVNVAKKEKQIVDGKEVYVMSKNPNDFTTVNAMRNRIKGKFDKLDVDKTLQAGVNVLGKDIESLVSQVSNTAQGGLIKSVNDITQRKDFGVETNEAISLFERSESTYLDSIMTQPTNISSILTEFVVSDPKTKQAYTYTWDSKKAGGNVILLKNDSAGRPVPEFTDAQKEVAKNALRERFRTMLDREIELKATPQAQAQYAPQYVYEAGKAAKNEQTVGNMIAMLYSGTPEQQQAAVNYFMGLPGVTDVTRDDNGIFITRDGVRKPIPFINEATKQRMSLDEFVRSSSSALLGKETDVNNILKGALGMGSKNFQSGTASASSQSTSPSEMYANSVGSTISNILKPSKFMDKTLGFVGSNGRKMTEEQVAEKVSANFSKLGFSAYVPWANGDFIIVKNKDGQESEEISLENPQNAMKAIEGFMLANVPGKTEEEKMIYLNSLKSKGIIKPAEQSANKQQPTKVDAATQTRIGGY